MQNLKNNLLFFLILFCALPVLQAQNWEQFGSALNGEDVGDNFGFSADVSADGNTLIVGSIQIGTDPAGNGYAKIYERSDSGWSQVGQTLFGTASNDQFGFSVAVSPDGGTIAIGAIGKNGPNGESNFGEVYVYTRQNTGQWLQKGDLITGTQTGSQSGVAVDFDATGDNIIIGANRFDGAEIDQGRAIVYTFANDEWTTKGQPIDGLNEEDLAGFAVAMNADATTIAITSFGHDIAAGNNGGLVQVYDWENDTWSFDNSFLGTSVGGQSGVAVSLSDDGNVIAIGANRHNGDFSDAGLVSIYSREGGDWSLSKEFFGEAEEELLGTGVDLSSDGKHIAFASFGATEIGYAKVFTQDENNEWVQTGLIIEATAAADQCCRAVAIDDDGNTIAVGAPSADGAAENAGQVRVFDIETESAVEQIPFAVPFTFSPNPTAEKVRVDFGKMYAQIDLTMTDLNGRHILTKQVENAAETTVEMPNTAGIYFLTLRGVNGEMQTLRVLRN